MRSTHDKLPNNPFKLNDNCLLTIFPPEIHSPHLSRAASLGQGSLLIRQKIKKEDKKEKTFILKHLKN